MSVQDAIRHFGHESNLVALHGFASTGQQFASLSDVLDLPVSAPDLPGHGRSSAEDCRHLAVFQRLSDQIPEEAPLLGYSQGARLALAGVALRYLRPRALILVSGTAGIEDDEERAARKAEDDARADRILEIGVEAFVEEWTSTGLTSMTHLPREVREIDREIRLENTPEGLAAALRGYGQGTLPSVWSQLDSINIPVLVIAGRRDRKYVEIGQSITDAIGERATFSVIDSSNHNPMLDQPEALAAAISAFLDGNS